MTHPAHATAHAGAQAQHLLFLAIAQHKVCNGTSFELSTMFGILARVVVQKEANNKFTALLQGTLKNSSLFPNTHSVRFRSSLPSSSVFYHVSRAVGQGAALPFG